MEEDHNLVHSEASSCRDDHLVGLKDPSPVEIGPALDASNSEKASSCRYDELKQIKDQVARGFQAKLKVIPIVGMGGIGKTTLAKRIYEDAETSYDFHLRAWVTISQEYKLRNVLLGLLRSMGPLLDEVSEPGNELLAEVLYKSLKGKRFLVVLDDMWNVEAWNELKWTFPDDSNGSRIILTSRNREVAGYVEPNSPPHWMNCLSNEESWRLLHDEVFIGKPCPSDLVKIGQEIANKCQGLPLAIVVVAGHLSKIDRNQDCWAGVAERLDSLIAENEERILDILCLSYNYLPQHSKACFLYMGFFPKNSVIHVLKLIRLWSAVGFLHSEDEAEKCLQDLINRNLITVRNRKFDGTAKTCGIHDLLWDLCLREARKEGHCIFSQANFGYSDSSASTDDMKYLMGLASTYLYFGYSFETDFLLTSICLRQLRVLNIQFQSFSRFPDKITDLVGLRYLELSTWGNIPCSVSKLCQLETLINRHPAAGLTLPKEIWLLRRLRHLQVGTCTFLPAAPCAIADGSCVTLLPDLRTISTISLARCTKQAFSSIPNVKGLKICVSKGEEEEYVFDCLNNLVHLHQLEKLSLYFRKKIGRHRRNLCWDPFGQCARQLTLWGSRQPWKEMRRQPQNLCLDIFPLSVKQLTLSGSHLPWEGMNILATLPCLEVLKLRNNAFKGPILEQTLEGFPKLKVLLFEDLDLEHWIANTIQFPVLQHLVLRSCYFLEELPDCFGEMPTLESIQLVACSRSGEESAKSIQKEHQSMGNYDFQVRIRRATTQMARVVLRLELDDDKMKNKAMETVSAFPGVKSISVNMRAGKMTIMGDVDPVRLLRKLRKHFHVYVISVAPVSADSGREDQEVELQWK